MNSFLGQARKTGKGTILSSSEPLSPAMSSVKRNRNRFKKSKKALLVITIVFCLLIIGFSAILLNTSPKNAESFPLHIGDSLNYPIYSPSKTTNGYHYKSGSAKIKTMLLFFSFENGPKTFLLPNN